MTDARAAFGILDENQRMAVFLLLNEIQENGRKAAVSLWGLVPYVFGLLGVVAIDYSITFTVLHAAAVPETPLLMIAIKSCMPLVAIGAFWFLDQKIAESTPSTATVRRGAAILGPLIPFGIGLYLGYESALSALDVLADASMTSTGGFGGMLDEDRTASIAASLGPLFAVVLGATVAGFFTVSSFVGHRCLTHVLDIARLYGATKGKAKRARRLVTEIMQANGEWGEMQKRKVALLRDGQPVRDAVMAVSEAGFNGLRHVERIVTARMLKDAPKPERIVIETGLPEDMAGWSLKGLRARLTELKAAFMPDNLFRVYRLFEDMKEVDHA